MKRKYKIVMALVPIFLFFDQFTKWLVIKRLYLGETIPVVPGFLNWHFLVNPGSAFGFFRNFPGQFRGPFYFLISLCAIAVIIYYLVLSEDSKVFFPVCLSLVLAGALGNLTDRARLGYVVDFILVEATFLGEGTVDKMDRWFGTHYWPSFNAADSLIVVGIIGMAIDLLFFTPAPDKKDAEDKSPKDNEALSAEDGNTQGPVNKS